MDDATLPPRDHNRPHIPAPEALRELLTEENADLAKRCAELVDAFARVPETIEDEETSGRVADFTKQLTAALKLVESRRESAKAPALDAGKAIDGFFRRLTDPVEKVKRALGDRLTLYGRKKAEAQRQRRAEEERVAREEAERQRKEAEDRAAAMRTEQDLASAVSADETARQAEADAAQASKAAAAKPAELSRVRGDLGAVASLVAFWDFKELDRNRLDLNALRPHIPLPALEQAVRAAIKSGVRQLGGVTIFENSKARVA